MRLRIAAALLMAFFALYPRPAGAAGGRVVLPTTVTPLAYRIGVIPDATALSFKGSAEIDVRINAATRTITLNAADLNIGSATLSGEAEAPAIRLDPKAQTMSLTFARPLQPSNRILTIAYSGKINRQASGLFALDYDASDGTPRRALYTQFENSDFRRFAPSWDEPGLKATFTLHVTLPIAEVAVSNMPVQSKEEAAPGLSTVRFVASPRMSTYLVSLNVGDFERVGREVDGVDVGVVVRRGEGSKASYALDVAERVLHYYNDYFGVRYPLPKLDLVAAPGTSQFFSAMENWGAILFFDSELMLDPRLATETDRQRVHNTIAHEMAHQWFGNLVTMAWWDDLWLNEGFANWMAAKVTGHFNPQWNVPARELSNKEYALALDAQAGSHPVVQPIRDVLQANQAFDDITYGKGEAVVTMLEAYVGAEAWRTGVRRYLARYQYGNTASDDLWREVDAASPRPVTAIAHEFTLRDGVPLIRVDRAGDAVRLSQTRFGLDPASRTPRRWTVPVAVGPASGPARTVTVAAGAPVSISAPSGGAVLANAGQAGYFRTAYSPAAFGALATAFPSLATVDQVAILLDAWALGRAGLVPVTELLDLSLHLPADCDPVVWNTVLTVLDAIDTLYDEDPGRPAFRAYARRLLAPLHARLGWDADPGEPDNVAVLRESLLNTLGWLGDKGVQAEARRRFATFLADQGSLPALVRRAMLRVVALGATSAEWDQLHTLAQSARDAAEKEELYGFLGLSEDPALARQTLALSVSDEPPATTRPVMLTKVAGWYRALAFDFYAAHTEEYFRLLESDSRDRFPAQLVDGTGDAALLRRLEAFMRAKIPETARGDVRRALFAGRNQRRLKAARIPEINYWLAAHHS